MPGLFKPLIFFLLIPIFVFGQSRFKTDSLKDLLAKPGFTGIERVDMLNRLAENLMRNNSSEATQYALKAIGESKSIPYPKGEGKAYRNLGEINSLQGNYDAALDLLDKSAKALSASAQYDEIGYALCLKGNIQRRKKLSAASMKSYVEAIHEFEKDNCRDGLGKAYSGMALLFVGQNDYPKAIEYHKQALAISIAIHDRLRTSISLGNLGIVELRLKHYDAALNYHFQSLKAMDGVNDSSRIAFIYNDIGAAYSQKGDPKKAIPYLLQSIGIRQKIKEFDELAYTLNYLGEAYEKAGDLPQATLFIKQANALAIKTRNTKQVLESYESISDFYSRHKVYDSAYVYSQKYKNFKDSVDVKESQRAMNAVRIQYETEKKEHQIALLNTQTVIQQLQIQKKNMTIAVIAGLFLLFVLISYQFYSRYKLKQAAVLQAEVMRQQDIATRGIIDAEERERKRLAAELHDGVGQLFTTVKMNMEMLAERFLDQQPEAATLTENTLLLVNESCGEIRSIAHQMMPNALLKSGLATALRDFVNKIPSEKLKVSLEVKLPEVIDATVETVLYRVIQESVNNVIKHSGADQLDILLLGDNKEITASIEDNGRGFDTTKKSAGIGMKNMYSRVEFLKGSVEVSSSPGKGTLIAIYIPLS